MKKCFILLGVMAVCLNLFAVGKPKKSHTCDDYRAPTDTFIPDWFDHLEEADNNDDSDYEEEFLQEHGGRAGTIVFQVQDNRYPMLNGQHFTGCSGTLIGKEYFLTAGHCAVTEVGSTFPAITLNGQIIYLPRSVKIKNKGILFGYQKADLENNDDSDEYDDDDDEINDDDSSVEPEYPRVSLKGYLDENGTYRLYGEEVPDMDIYSDFDLHPAYFPLVDDDIYTYYEDGSLEHGWEMTDDDTNKVDYAIYKLGKNSNIRLPFEDDDPWSWISDNNQASENTRPPYLVTPWQLPDNTNGKRGWARVNTAVLQQNSSINIIGSPGISKIYDGENYYSGLKVVNAGNVVEGSANRRAYSFYEDVLVFERADIQVGHSGSSVIDSSGRVAGVVSWIGCNIIPEENIFPEGTMSAENYATPMWKICRASQIIKDAARDQNCNGQIDWWDLIGSFENIDYFININGLLIDRFELHPIPLDLKNYRYDARQQRVVTETKEIPAYTYQVAFQNNGNFFYIAKQNNAFYLFQNGTALGAISNYPEMSVSSTLVKGNDIYLAGGTLSIPTPMLPGSGNNNFQPYITKISSNGQNGYNFSGVATIPANLEDIRIFALGNDIYVSGNTGNNFAVYKLVADNQSEFGYSLSVINSSQPVRKDYNLTASDGKIIVSGGATDYIRNVLNIEEGNPYPEGFAVYNNIIMLEPAVSNNWVTVAENINDKLIMMSVTAIENGELVIINPFITVGNSMQKIVMDLSEIPINGENLRVDFEFDPVVYCLNESENTLSGGLTISGECVSFTHQWYNSFSAGATVYSLDGKGDRLFVGTNNAIKVYDISDPISPVLVSSFSTSSRVNDLEVYGDSLFAATNGGLYKLDASDPDELTQILFISTTLNYQYKVEVYNGKLYVGDDNGIKIRDLETLSVLASVNNGSVLDFAIENGEIGLYKDALLSPVEIRDAETLTLKANEFFGCFEIEVGSSDGRFYLSCDYETYRFEDDGDGGISFTELSGDIRELQDVYTFDGYTYLYDENTIWISTSSDVPAICGNGIVEGDEVCDGGQIDCAELDVSGNVSTNSGFVSGTATCNSTCDGYNTNNCSDDGW